MAIGDIWRVDVVGLTQAPGPGPGDFRTSWVNVWFLQVTAGIVTPTTEAQAAIDIIHEKFTDSAAQDLFGKGTALKTIRAVRESDGFQGEEDIEEDIGAQFVEALPPQVCVVVTGRNGAEGRRTMRYVAGISLDWLGTAGQLLVIGPVANLVDWFSSGSSGVVTMRPVIFDRDGVLPTLFVDRARISPGFRTQRRRTVNVLNEVTTVYLPVG